MNDTFHQDAAAATAAAAENAPVRPEYDGRRYIPVRATDLAELLRVQAEHGRLLAQIADHLGITTGT